MPGDARPATGGAALGNTLSGVAIIAGATGNVVGGTVAGAGNVISTDNGGLFIAIEEVDLDDIFDELGRYVRRNPEVLVVDLATITVSAGLIVYLNARNEFGFDDDDVPVRSTPRAAGSARSRK